MREYSIVKPKFFKDGMEFRRNGQTVGRYNPFATDRGEALGRSWAKTVASINGSDVAADEPRNTTDFSTRVHKADRVGYSLNWGDGGERFGEFMDDRWEKKWVLTLGGKTLYWWGYTPFFGGARFGYDDSDDRNYLTATRSPLRTQTWQKIAVDDEFPEPEGIVAAQIGHSLWDDDYSRRQSHGNSAFLISRLSR